MVVWAFMNAFPPLFPTHRLLFSFGRTDQEGNVGLRLSLLNLHGIEFLLQRRSRPDTCQQVALAEAICYQLPREVWRILSHGLLLTECLPTSGIMTVNPLTLHLQSRSLVVLI